jgi:hypothetical protein
MQTESKYRFPASYGWGWGLPYSWQGWLVLVCFRCAECPRLAWCLLYVYHRALWTTHRNMLAQG